MKAKKKTRAAAWALVLALLLSVLPVTALADEGAGLNAATPETNDWTVTKTDAGTYDMGIVPGDFENTNKNFTNVEFEMIGRAHV